MEALVRLELGGIETINTPSPDDIRHHIRYMRVESPFVVLNRGDDSFIQTVYDGIKSVYRVEYCDGMKWWCAVADYEKTVDLFLAYQGSDPDLLGRANWKRFRRLNPRFESVLAWSLLCLFVAALILIMLYTAGLI